MIEIWAGGGWSGETSWIGEAGAEFRVVLYRELGERDLQCEMLTKIEQLNQAELTPLADAMASTAETSQ